MGESATGSILMETSKGSAAHFYLPELDVLRFFAAFGVFVFHSFPKTAEFWVAHGVANVLAVPLVSLVGSGGFGVDLFFTLSSFLITNLMLRERQERGFLDVRSFYIRRILRIWPLYFFFIGLSYALTFIDHSQEFDGKYIASYLLLFGNWICVLRGMPQSVAIPLWSVSIEEQFYLSWPQIVKRANIGTIIKVAWILIGVSVAVRLMLAARGVGSVAVWCNTLTRLDPIAVGILFSAYARDRSLNPSRIQRLGLASMGLLCWVFVTHYSHIHDLSVGFWGIVLGYPVVALGSLLLIAAVYGAPRAGLHFFENKTLIYLGKISYGIYVYHMLGLLISHYLFGAYTKHAGGYLIYWFTSLVLTISFAILSYHLLEAPFLRLKKKFTFVTSRPV